MTTLTINGREVEVDVPADMPLLWALRETLGLTGTKYGCGIAACGACTVHVDGVATRSCQLTVEAAAGSAITTIEGIVGQARQGGADGLAAARRGPVRLLPVGPDHGGDRAPGREPKPSDDDIDAAMSGNICRCATYQRIRAAVHAAAKLMEA